MPIYFDNATTSFPKPKEVCDAVLYALSHLGGTSGRGNHQMAYEAEKVLFKARTLIADFFHIPDSKNIIFTSNATEALNLALKGLLKENNHVITSSMEHNALMRPLCGLQKKGISHTIIPTSSNGQIDPSDIKKAIKKNTRLIALAHASNIIGTINPIEEIGHIARSHGLIFLVDAAQTAGYIPINVKKHNIHILAATGHKSLLGPQGTGFLYVDGQLRLTPLIEGGTGSTSEENMQPDHMPDRLQSGTVNTPGISGLLAGIEFIQKFGLEQIRNQSLIKIKKILEELKIIPNITLYGSMDSSLRTPAISFTVKGMDPAKTTSSLWEKFEIITRVGLHCAPYAHKTIGTFPEGTVRLSPGIFNTNEETDYVTSCIRKIAHENR